MAPQQSPFAALTGMEKQLKWLQCKSATLPYVQTEVDVLASPIADNPPPPDPDPTPTPKPETTRVLPQPPPETFVSMNKPRHHQYDAVIARMKQAEKQARTFQSFSQTP